MNPFIVYTSYDYFNPLYYRPTVLENFIELSKSVFPEVVVFVSQFIFCIQNNTSVMSALSSLSAGQTYKCYLCRLINIVTYIHVSDFRR